MKNIEEIKWSSASPGSVPKKLSEIDNQHLSNILWFNEIFHNWSIYNSPIHLSMAKELSNRGVERLLWKPLPILNEIKTLKEMGMLNLKGDIVKLISGDVIGSITHIKEWNSLIK